jgi:hypothetical protein
VRDRRKVDRIDRDAFEVTLGCRRLTADTTKACSPVLPIVQALAAAQRRDDLTGKISDAEKTQGSTPTIKSADPQAEQVSKLVAWITRGWIAPTPEDIALVRILGLTIVPSLSGLAFLFAFALAATCTALAARP